MARELVYRNDTGVPLRCEQNRTERFIALFATTHVKHIWISDNRRNFKKRRVLLQCVMLCEQTKQTFCLAFVENKKHEYEFYLEIDRNIDQPLAVLLLPNRSLNGSGDNNNSGLDSQDSHDSHDSAETSTDTEIAFMQELCTRLGAPKYRWSVAYLYENAAHLVESIVDKMRCMNLKNKSFDEILDTQSANVK